VNINDIPVRVIGPGSQPGADTDAASFIDMPRDMSKYDMPVMPDPDSVQHLLGAREAMSWLQTALNAVPDTDAKLLANLNALDDENRELVNQILGEGEVSITYSADLAASVQESVLAGVWRSLYFDKDENVAVDMLEVAAVPNLVLAPFENARAVDTTEDASRTDVANAMPILIELEDSSARFARDGTTHTINLTLLPLSEDELEFLDTRLGRGPVDILSRAYGKCQVISTLTPNIWWVRYYNSMGTLILNTVEITDVPQVVIAAPEDLTDSGERLAEILAPYWPDVA
jgi:hydrogenase-1 operon protein HyaF